MGLSELLESIALLLVCIVLPSALAMYFSAPPPPGASHKQAAGRTPLTP
jgi:hypothetical protein